MARVIGHVASHGEGDPSPAGAHIAVKTNALGSDALRRKAA